MNFTVVSVWYSLKSLKLCPNNPSSIEHLPFDYEDVYDSRDTENFVSFHIIWTLCASGTWKLEMEKWDLNKPVILARIEKNTLNKCRLLVGAFKHWFQYTLLIILCPNSYWKLRYFYSIIFQLSHFSATYISCIVQLLNCSAEIFKPWYLQELTNFILSKNNYIWNVNLLKLQLIDSAYSHNSVFIRFS